jgi:hypothetical protein
VVGIIPARYYTCTIITGPTNSRSINCGRPGPKKLKTNSVSENVNTITVETLISKYNIENIDILQIDTEGYDKFIFDEFWKSGIRPNIVRIEIVYMKMLDMQHIINLLKSNNYVVYIEGEDLTAVK